MEAPFRLTANDHPTLLQQIPIDVGAGDAAVRGKSNADKLAESTRVVVPLRLGVPERFQDRVGLEDLSLEKA
jgi:hypothetical protein